jgi:hypothetical protein
MKLTLKRVSKNPDYTIGKLHIDGVYFCDTLEDTDRGLQQDMPLEEIHRRKVSGSTAIPTGTYNVAMNVVSPRFSQHEMYQSIGGKLPRIENVPGYDGVLIHVGNTPKDTEGCILVGQNNQVGMVLNSRTVFFELYEKLKGADEVTLVVES